jgi:hypothetical protein
LILKSYFAVNELSNTIDLEQTLTKAEALFRRFQRTVEAIDRKTSSLPEPSTLRQRTIGSDTTAVNKPTTSSRATAALLKTPGSAPVVQGGVVEVSGSDAIATTITASASNSTPATAATGEDSTGKSKAAVKGKSRQWPNPADTPKPEPMKTISPELRALLSRDVIKLDKKEVQKHGGGVGR